MLDIKGNEGLKKWLNDAYLDEPQTMYGLALKLSLTKKQIEVLIAYYIDELSTIDIQAEYDTNTGNVSNLLARGRNNINSIIARVGLDKLRRYYGEIDLTRKYIRSKM